MSNFCTNCGNVLNDNVTICPKCGMQITQSNGANQMNNMNTIPSMDTTNTMNNMNAVPSTNKTNGIAIAGLILSFIIPIIGLVLSIIGLKKSKEINNGRGLSIAGIIISAIFTVISIIIIVLMFSSAMSVTKTMINAKSKIFQNTANEVEDWFTKQYELDKLSNYGSDATNAPDPTYTTFVNSLVNKELPTTASSAVNMTSEVLYAAGIVDTNNIEGTVYLNGYKICIELTAREDSQFYNSSDSTKNTVSSIGCQ